MNRKIASLIAILAPLIIFNANASAADGDCANETSAKVSQKCLKELARSMAADEVSKKMRKALEGAYPLRSCSIQPTSELKIEFTEDEAVGRVLTVSAIVDCESDDDGVGYSISGEYGLDPSYFRFKQITLNTAE